MVKHSLRWVFRDPVWYLVDREAHWALAWYDIEQRRFYLNDFGWLDRHVFGRGSG